MLLTLSTNTGVTDSVQVEGRTAREKACTESENPESSMFHVDDLISVPPNLNKEMTHNFREGDNNWKRRAMATYGP